MVYSLFAWNIRVLLFEVDNRNNKAIEGMGRNTTHSSIVSLEATAVSFDSPQNSKRITLSFSRIPEIDSGKKVLHTGYFLPKQDRVF